MPDELVESEIKDQKDQIVITLHETPEKELSLRSVDVFVPSMRVRLTTPTTDQIESVFHRDVAELIRRICGSANMPKQIINVPDFTLRFRGLAIRGYTLLVHTLEDGMRQFIVRLKRGVGNALALFRQTNTAQPGLNVLGGDDNTSDAHKARSGRLFDEMLSQLYLPLVNLNSYLRNALDKGEHDRESGIASSVVQLKTRAEMLQFAFDRLISEMMLEKYTSGDRATKPNQPYLGYTRLPAKDSQGA